jgi:hypothetical protein
LRLWDRGPQREAPVDTVGSESRRRSEKSAAPSAASAAPHATTSRNKMASAIVRLGRDIQSATIATAAKVRAKVMRSQGKGKVE